MGLEIMISESRHFIFVHLPKTGGCSIEKSLSSEFSLNSPHPLRKKGFHLNYQHATLEENIDFHDGCSTFFSFCFVRNPWDRIVSFYSHRSQRHGAWKTGSRPPDSFSFESMVNYLYFKNFPDFFVHCPYTFIRPCSTWTKGTSFVGRFENLQLDFDKVCATLGVRLRKLPKSNKSSHKEYTSYYNDDLINMVGDMYKQDIEAFNYKFNG